MPFPGSLGEGGRCPHGGASSLLFRGTAGALNRRTRDAAPAQGVDVCSAGPVQLTLTPLGLDRGHHVRGLGV